MATIKTLIAIAGCRRHAARANAQWDTWVRDVRGADVRLFVGAPGQPREFANGEVWLDCPDDYLSFKTKVLSIFRWALDHGYEYLWKVDDDVYLRPERLLALEPHDYQGVAVDMRTVPNAWPYLDRNADEPILGAMGQVYGLSARSMKSLLTEVDPRPKCWQEDFWTALRLRDLGVVPFQLGGLVKITHRKGEPTNWPNQEPPRPENRVVASFEYTGEQMEAIHLAFCR